MRLRRLRDVTAGGLPPALPEPNQRLPRPRLALPHRPLLQGPDPHRLRAFLGASAPLLHGARVPERVPGRGAGGGLMSSGNCHVVRSADACSKDEGAASHAIIYVLRDYIFLEAKMRLILRYPFTLELRRTQPPLPVSTRSQKLHQSAITELSPLSPP